MSEKVWPAHNQAHSAEQTPGETKQGRYGESWQKLKSGLLVPGLGVVATMTGDGKIIVTDRRGRADRYQSAETPNLDDDSLQHDEGVSRNLGEEEQQPQNPKQLDDSEWFTPPGDVEFGAPEFRLIEQSLKDAIEWGDDLLLTRLNADWLSPLLKALCWQLDQHAYILDNVHQTSLLRGAIDSCLNEGEGSDRAIKLSEITDKITEANIIKGCDGDAVYRKMLRPQWRIDPEGDERLRDKVEERIKDVQTLLGDEPPTSSEIVYYAAQFEKIHGFVPSCFTLYNWLSQHPDVGEKHATEQ
jgi:hypothetical protein